MDPLAHSGWSALLRAGRPLHETANDETILLERLEIAAHGSVILPDTGAIQFVTRSPSCK